MFMPSESGNQTYNAMLSKMSNMSTIYCILSTDRTSKTMSTGTTEVNKFNLLIEIDRVFFSLYLPSTYLF